MKYRSGQKLFNLTKCNWYTNRIIVFSVLLFLVKCNNSDTNEWSTTDSAKTSQAIDSVIQAMDSTIIETKIDLTESPIEDYSMTDPNFSLLNKVYYLGERYGLTGCRLVLECDCCVGKLILLSDSTYYYVDDCMADLIVTRGSFSSLANTFKFSSDGVYISKSCDPLIFDKSNEIIYTLTDTIKKPYELILQLKSCNQKPIFLDESNNPNWLATLTDFSVEDELNNLKKDGILKLFRKNNAAKVVE